MEVLFQTDICVIGAGPAGCITARRLAEMGFKVCILESKTFPRSHVGICFSEDSFTLLDYFGVREEVEKSGFLKRQTTILKWQSEEPVLTPQSGFHADRGKFDQILLKKAISAGVKSIQPAKAIKILSTNTGWNVTYEMAGQRKEIVARFLVDAAGANGILPGKKIRMAPPLFAMHAVWRLKNIPYYDGFIEASKNSWLWFARINDKEALITVFADPKHLTNSASTRLDAHYHQLLRFFSLLKSCELEAMQGDIVGCDACSRYSDDPVGQNYIRVGDANVKVDPLASQGVHLAMISALQAAIVVNTILRKPENQLHAIEFYRSRQKEKVDQFRIKTASAYRQVTKRFPDPFWLDRSRLTEDETAKPDVEIILPEESVPVQLSPQTNFRSIPIMEEDLIAFSPALHHPCLDRPVAYLSGQSIVPLLMEVGKGKSAANLINMWSGKMASGLASEIFSWLWVRGILIRDAYK